MLGKLHAVSLRSFVLLGFIVIAGSAGSILLMRSHASTPTANIEAENGSISGAISTLTDGTASGGKSIKFGTPTSSGFIHPGILVSTTQLNFVKAKIAAGQEPWKTFFSQLQSASTSLGSIPNTPFTSLNYVPHPVAHMICPVAPASGEPASCLDEKNDAIAAYADALMWYYSSASNRDAYAQKSIEILNAWSGTLIDHVYNNDNATYNAILQASWVGAITPRAAEIIRYTYTPPAGEATLDIPQLTHMLNTAYLPLVNYIKPSGGANGIAAGIEASVNISIFTDNRTEYNTAIARWRTEVPSLIYAASDVNPSFVNLAGKGYPIPPAGVSWVNPNVSTNYLNSYWYQPTNYPAGIEGETCRDPAHMAGGFGPTIATAETARLQGINLYGEEASRIVTGMELNTGFIKESMDSGTTTPAGWPCVSGMASPASNLTWKVTFEVGYNEFANRLHMSLPNTDALLTKYSRPSGYKADFSEDFEGLTSYGTP
jgi:hypothetical protein